MPLISEQDEADPMQGASNELALLTWFNFLQWSKGWWRWCSTIVKTGERSKQKDVFFYPLMKQWVFHGSNIPLWRWVIVLYYFVSHAWWKLHLSIYEAWLAANVGYIKQLERCDALYHEFMNFCKIIASAWSERNWRGELFLESSTFSSRKGET